MTKDELIAVQALRLEEQAQRIKGLEEDAQAIRGELYCIGGPLNDNYMGYTPEQLKPFMRIAERVEPVNGPTEPRS